MTICLLEIQNDADNANICAYILKYLQIFTNIYKYWPMCIGEYWLMVIPNLYPSLSSLKTNLISTCFCCTSQLRKWAPTLPATLQFFTADEYLLIAASKALNIVMVMVMVLNWRGWQWYNKDENYSKQCIAMTAMVLKILRMLMMKQTKAGRPSPPSRERSHCRSQLPCKLSALANERIFLLTRIFFLMRELFLLMRDFLLMR